MKNSLFSQHPARTCLFPLAFAIILVLARPLSADLPEQLHYQGYLTNSAGNPIHCPNTLICSTPYDITFRLYGMESGGTPVWTETYEAVSINQGIFQIKLGSLLPLNASVLDAPSWLGVEVNGNGEMEPRQAILPAAYAIQAEHANIADNSNSLGGKPAGAYALLGDMLSQWPILNLLGIEPSGNLAFSGIPVIGPTGDWLGNPTGLEGPQGPQGASPFTLNETNAVYMDGGVLIGVNESAAWKFVVQGAGGALGHVGAFSSNQEVAYLGLISAKEARYLYTHDDGRFGIHIPGVGDLLTITADGNMGIGKIEPQQALDVTGSIQADGIYFPDGSYLTSAPAEGGGAAVMYLRKSSSSSGGPGFCPSGWAEADYQAEQSGPYLNHVRTCYRTDSSCTIMYLRKSASSSGEPGECPGGWTEADYQTEQSSPYLNHVRTCYLCP